MSRTTGCKSQLPKMVSVLEKRLPDINKEEEEDGISCDFAQSIFSFKDDNTGATISFLCPQTAKECYEKMYPQKKMEPDQDLDEVVVDDYDVNCDEYFKFKDVAELMAFAYIAILQHLMIKKIDCHCNVCNNSKRDNLFVDNDNPVWKEDCNKMIKLGNTWMHGQLLKGVDIEFIVRIVKRLYTDEAFKSDTIKKCETSVLTAMAAMLKETFNQRYLQFKVSSVPTCIYNSVFHMMDTDLPLTEPMTH